MSVIIAVTLPEIELIRQNFQLDVVGFLEHQANAIEYFTSSRKIGPKIRSELQESYEYCMPIPLERYSLHPQINR